MAATATHLPVHVGAGRGFADDPVGVARTVTAPADVGAAGRSIEDRDPCADRIEPFDSALERVAAAGLDTGVLDLALPRLDPVLTRQPFQGWPRDCLGPSGPGDGAGPHSRHGSHPIAPHPPWPDRLVE